MRLDGHHNQKAPHANPHPHPPLEKDMDAGDAKKLASFYAPSVAELYRLVAHEPKLRLIGGSLLEDPHWLETSVVMQPNIAATAALAAAATNGGGAASALSSSARRRRRRPSALVVRQRAPALPKGVCAPRLPGV